MLSQFWNKNTNLLHFTIGIATISALFLNIPGPESGVAKTALVNIQMFWLVVFVICLCQVFWIFLKTVREHDIQIFKNFGILTLSTGYIFFFIILNICQFIINFEPQHTAQSFNMILGISLVIILILGIMHVEKNSTKYSLLTKIILWSFTVSASITFLGLFIETQIHNYFHFYWVIFILPGIFVVVTFIATSIALYRKDKLIR